MTKYLHIVAFFFCCTIIFAFKKWEEPRKQIQRDGAAYEVKVIATENSWIIWYPGKDGLFGKLNQGLIDSKNPLGVILSDENFKDDLILFSETFHLIKGWDYRFIFSSLKGDHVFYLPQFRVQMDVYSDRETNFSFNPNRSSLEVIKEFPDSNNTFVLTCNDKLNCKQHLQVELIVDEDFDSFDFWYQSLLQKF